MEFHGIPRSHVTRCENPESPDGNVTSWGHDKGEKVVAITDHAALTWSKTFQNVNRRLMSWGAVFSAYPDLEIVHRAGRVHSNVDPISRLRRRTPLQDGPIADDNATLHLAEDAGNVFGGAEPEDSTSYEERVLRLMKGLVGEKEKASIPKEVMTVSVDGQEEELEVPTARAMTTLVAIESEELESHREAYENDAYFQRIIADLRSETDWSNPRHPEYFFDDRGLLYYSDWAGHARLCVPVGKKYEIMKEIHEKINHCAHAGYYRTYNRVASTYYWPRMSRDIKAYVRTCDVCQKVKSKRHAPIGLLQPIPIPSEPFEIVSMDFVPDLPPSDSYNNVFVIVDKLTKYAIFLPTTTNVDEVETAKMFYKAVYLPYGMPKQIISDRDSRWSNSFWGTLTSLMGSRRALTMSHHPQADGQTEVLNQFLEVGLRTFTGPSRDDWSSFLDLFAHSYNSGIQASTGFSPAYLLRGYQPREPENLLSGSVAPVPRIRNGNLDAEAFAEAMRAHLHQAQTALHIAQTHQRTAYNRGRLNEEFDEGDLVMINPHSMELAKDLAGKGKKLLARYDGPFEILTKISPVTYRLRLPSSYGIHPVISIAHLERYHASPEEFGERETKKMNRADFVELPEVEVQEILAEREKTIGRNRIKEYLVRFEGFDASHDEWLTERRLVNAPEAIREWERRPRQVEKPTDSQVHEPGSADESTPSDVSEMASKPEDNAAPGSSRHSPVRSNRRRKVAEKAKDNPELRRLGWGRQSKLKWK